MIKHIPHASTHIPYECKGFIGEPIDLSDKGVVEIFGTDDSLIFGVSRLVCDVERLEENEPMDDVGMGICYTHNANLEPMRIINDKDYIIEKYYRPHHKALEDMVTEELEKYGEAVIIDCHTYRREPWPYEKDIYRPEICIGFDKPSWLSDYICTDLDLFDIGINVPFNGSVKPLKYLNDDRVKSVMIEVRQDLPIEKMKAVIQPMLDSIRYIQLENSPN